MRVQTDCQEREGEQEQEEQFTVSQLSGLVLCRCLSCPVTIQLASPSIVDHREALDSERVYVLAEI